MKTSKGHWHLQDDLRVGISLASPETIRAWSSGEVTNHQLLFYGQEVRGGLFCETIFGPERDWTCVCGQCRGEDRDEKPNQETCKVCGAAVTYGRVRRRSMGHIELAVPVVHRWFFAGDPSRLSVLLGMKGRALEAVVYYEAHVVLDPGGTPLRRGQVLGEKEYSRCRKEHGTAFQVSMGGEAVQKLLEGLDLAALAEKLRAALAWKEAIRKRQREVRAERDRLLEKLREGRQKRTQDYPQLVLERKELLRQHKEQRTQQRSEHEQWVKELGTLDESRLTQRLALVESLRRSGNRPEWMVLQVLPVIPPDLRPLLPLEKGPEASEDGGARSRIPRFAAADLNRLYQDVIRINNQLRVPREESPEESSPVGRGKVMPVNTRRLLQQAVDALLDNQHCRAPSLDRRSQPLKSLTDLIRGKQGRFRKNLLGKRVDYSGRSVIVGGPSLRLHQCGLPRDIALQLYRPFLLHRLARVFEQMRARSLAAIKLLLSLCEQANGAGRPSVSAEDIRGLRDELRDSSAYLWAVKQIEQRQALVWDLLEEVVVGRPVLLNRAPTLHRLGVQAFEPVLIADKAIRLHPLVCAGFGADFDGDTMGVHFPLGEQARKEAAERLLSAKHLLSPANGRSSLLPSQDIILGCYYLTATRGELGESGEPGEGKTFANVAEVLSAYDQEKLGVHARIHVRLPRDKKVVREVPSPQGKSSDRVLTTVGRVLFNDILNPKMAFYDLALSSKQLERILTDCYQLVGPAETVALLDRIKDLGFREATRSGLSFLLEDLRPPPRKGEQLKLAAQKVRDLERQCAEQKLSESAMVQKSREVWKRALEEITKDLHQALQKDVRDRPDQETLSWLLKQDRALLESGPAQKPYLNPVYLMAQSGARGKWEQLFQLAALRGLMSRASGEPLDRLITSNLREGLGLAEFFLSAHGAYAAGADKKSVPKAGYLTRKLVDVTQNVVITEDDCGILDTSPGPHGVLKGAGLWGCLGNADEPRVSDKYFQSSIQGRVSCDELLAPDDAVLVGRNEWITAEKAAEIARLNLRVRVRSPMTCIAAQGVCQRCYGMDLSTGEPVQLGTAVGVIAAQSIGERATQLPLKTKHTAGVARDRAKVSVLRRVENLLEASPVRSRSLPVFAGTSGTLRVEKRDKGAFLVIRPANSSAGQAEADGVWEHPLPEGRFLRARDGDQVEKGEPLTDDPVPLHHLLHSHGVEAVSAYLLGELQGLHHRQGVAIDDKHFEVVVGQMLRKVKVKSAGDSGLAPDTLIDRSTLLALNGLVQARGGQPATSSPHLLGIRQAAVKAESFLAAASFQNTAEVLADAALAGKTDDLAGLKENLMLGRLIPAGTGFRPERAGRPSLPPLDPVPPQPRPAPQPDASPPPPVPKDPSLSPPASAFTKLADAEVLLTYYRAWNEEEAEEAWKEFERRWLPRLIAWALDRYRQGGTYAAQQIAQQALDRVLDSRGLKTEFDPSRGTALEAWLSQIVRNEVVEYIRGHVMPTASLLPRTTEDEEEGHEGIEEVLVKPVDSTEAMWLSREKKVALRSCVDHLPQEQREIIHLVFWEDLAQKDIALVLKKTQKVISEEKTAALTLLLECMKRKNIL